MYFTVQFLITKEIQHIWQRDLARKPISKDPPPQDISQVCIVPIAIILEIFDASVKVYFCILVERIAKKNVLKNLQRVQNYPARVGDHALIIWTFLEYISRLSRP